MDNQELTSVAVDVSHIIGSVKAGILIGETCKLTHSVAYNDQITSILLQMLSMDMQWLSA